MAEGETSDRVTHDRGTSIEWTRGPPDHDQGTCLNWSVVMAAMKWRGSHLGRPIAIQGALFETFYNAFSLDRI